MRGQLTALLVSYNSLTLRKLCHCSVLTQYSPTHSLAITHSQFHLPNYSHLLLHCSTPTISNSILLDLLYLTHHQALQHRDMRGGLAPSLPDRHIVSALTVTHPNPPASQGQGLGQGSIDQSQGGDIVTLTSLLTLAPVQVTLFLYLIIPIIYPC